MKNTDMRSLAYEYMELNGGGSDGDKTEDGLKIKEIRS